MSCVVWFSVGAIGGAAFEATAPNHPVIAAGSAACLIAGILLLVYLGRR